MKRLNLSSGVLTSIWTLMCFPGLRTSFWLYIFNLLSTPSLGIPRRDRSLLCLPTRRHSFNSLSRDHAIAGAFAYEYLYMKSFQLPLSGSLTPILTTVAIVAVIFFQLPLSGSPSPIPGFFGSPRLSAAATLRTNDFEGHYLDISFRPFIRAL